MVVQWPISYRSLALEGWAMLGSCFGLFKHTSSYARLKDLLCLLCYEYSEAVVSWHCETKYKRVPVGQSHSLHLSPGPPLSLCTLPTVTMRFSTVLISLALSAGLAVAGPVDASVPAVSVVVGVSSTPEFTPSEAHAPAGSKESDGDQVTIFGDEGETTKEISKREEYNPLNGCAPATLILCSGSRCGGRCFGINLNAIRFNRCYITRPYNSLFISARGGLGLGYGVYVGRRCRGEVFSLASRIDFKRIFSFALTLVRRGSDFVFAFVHVKGVLVPRVGVCYRITPTGNTFFKR